MVLLPSCLGVPEPGAGCESVPEQLAQTVSRKLSLPCSFRFTPVIKETSQGGLKQPKPAARPPMQVPEYDLQPSGTVCPRNLPALCPILDSGLGQKRQQAHHPSPPALLKHEVV